MCERFSLEGKNILRDSISRKTPGSFIQDCTSFPLFLSNGSLPKVLYTLYVACDESLTVPFLTSFSRKTSILDVSPKTPGHVLEAHAAVSKLSHFFSFTTLREADFVLDSD